MFDQSLRYRPPSVTTAAPAPEAPRVRLTRARASLLSRGPLAALLAAALVTAAPARAAPPQETPPTPRPAAPQSSPQSSPQGASDAPRPDAPRPDAQAEKQARIERALALHDEARARYQRGEYRAAIVKLEEALALDPEGKELVYNLAIIHEKLGDIEQSEAYFRRYLEMETDPEVRAEVEATLRRLEGARKELAPPPAPRARPKAPPKHASRPLPQEPPAPRPIRPSVIVAGGVAAGALVISNVFALSAILRDPGSDAKTGPGLSADEILSDARSAHRDAVVADVALLIAGAAGGLALYFYLSTPRPERPPASAPAPAFPAPVRPFSRDSRGAGISLSIGGSGARLQVRF